MGVAMQLTSVIYQRIVLFVSVLLNVYLEQRPLGTVVMAPFAMQILDAEQSGSPDVMFIRAQNAGLLKATLLEGVPDVAIEVVSMGSTAIDRGTKFLTYEAAGIPEYWLIDPERDDALFYHLIAVKNDEGIYELRYRRIELDANGDFQSIEISGFRLHVEMLWADKLPTTSQIIEIVRVMLDIRN